MTLTAAQSAAVAATEPYCLVSAGPGSGKSRVLVERIGHLIRGGVSTHRIVAISYTIAASGVLQDRICGMPLGFCGTLHAWMLKLLTRYGHYIGLANPLSVIDEDEHDDILCDVLEETAYRGSLKAVAAEVALGPVARLNPMTKEQIAAEAFFQKLRSEGILTYEMILHAGERLLKTLADKGHVEADHLVVDEAQDLTEQDWRIIDATGIPNQFVVGDFDQRIMSFRGSCGEFERRCND